MGGGQGAKPPGSLVSAAAYIHDISMAIDIATALGHSDDVNAWTALRAGYVSGFNAAFFNAASSNYGNSNGDGLQSANAAALALGFVPTGSVAAVANALQNDVANTHENHWFVGIFGMKYLWRALTANGFGDTAIDALLVEGYPGFQFWFNNDLVRLHPMCMYSTQYSMYD
jgi:alpha-L-rhamnosidase